jgi:hypothetical protein
VTDVADDAADVTDVADDALDTDLDLIDEVNATDDTADQVAATSSSTTAGGTSQVSVNAFPNSGSGESQGTSGVPWFLLAAAPLLALAGFQIRRKVTR